MPEHKLSLEAFSVGHSGQNETAVHQREINFVQAISRNSKKGQDDSFERISYVFFERRENTRRTMEYMVLDQMRKLDSELECSRLAWCPCCGCVLRHLRLH
jgi:hypothetical protein